MLTCWQVARHRRRREGYLTMAGLYYSQCMPAQRLAEILGTPTHAQLSLLFKKTTDTMNLARHWSGQRQLIAVTCIAEHA